MNVDLYNFAFLETHPEIKRKIMRKIRRPKVIVMALKPVMFSESVTGIPLAVWDIVKTNKCYTKNLAGISLPDLEAYAGKKLVTALRVYKFKRFDKPIPLEAKAPQNWGRYAYVANSGIPTL